MQSTYPNLNLPAIELKTRRNSDDNSISVWVATRRCYLRLTPEEWVRRHIVAYLISHCSVEPIEICEEYPVNVNGQPQRADVVVVNRNGEPQIVVECKAPNIAITKDVLSQAVRYNATLKARYIILSNGLQHFCFNCNHTGELQRLDSFPIIER